MARLEIIEHPDPRLREVAKPVTTFDAALSNFIDDLFDTLYATGGMAFSAPQVGDGRRVLVMDLSEDRTDPQVYINPEELKRDAWGLVEESCLSVPGVVGNVMRGTKVRVRAQDRAGGPFEQDLEGMAAVCLQHEIDHLDGTLFIDRISFLGKWYLRLFSREYRKGAVA